MKYFLDTEFLEETQKKRFLGIPYGNTKNTIDLISIGIVGEDSKEYYEISKDFNLKEAWNRSQLDINKQYPMGTKKVYWVRENVLKPIYKELRLKELEETCNSVEDIETYFTDKKYFKEFKRLINKYGKSNKTIAEEVKDFCYNDYWFDPKKVNSKFKSLKDCVDIQIYAYYADYDWVVFCWLFGKMIDLPKRFPKYCIDLKQILDEKVNALEMYEARDCFANDPERFMKGELQADDRLATLSEKLEGIKQNHPDYPQQENEHNALDDAKWNKKLYKFINDNKTK